MGQQKQGGGKTVSQLAREKQSRGKGNNGGSDGSRASQKQSAEYLRGPKGGGPTTKEIVRAHDLRVAREQKEAIERQKHPRPYWWQE